MLHHAQCEGRRKPGGSVPGSLSVQSPFWRSDHARMTLLKVTAVLPRTRQRDPASARRLIGQEPAACSRIAHHSGSCSARRAASEEPQRPPSHHLAPRPQVLPCACRSPHSWADCPFAHPGESVRRRSLGRVAYSSDLCPHMRRAEPCPAGEECTYVSGGRGLCGSGLAPSQSAPPRNAATRGASSLWQL